MTSDLVPHRPDRSQPIGQSRLARIGGRALSFVFLTMVRAVLSLFLGAFKRSEVYAEAILRARSNTEVRRRLGEPIREGWWVSGSMKVAGPSGAAKFATTLHGSARDAALLVQARKQGGRWQFDVLEVAVRGTSDRIDLIGSPAHGRRHLTTASPPRQT